MTFIEELRRVYESIQTEDILKQEREYNAKLEKWMNEYFDAMLAKIEREKK